MSAPSVTAVEMTLRATVSGTVQDPVSKSRQESTEARQTRVVAGPGLLVYEEGSGSSVVLDFERQRRMTVNRSGGTYCDDALCTVVAMRHVELPNRTHIRKVLEAGKGPTTEFTPLMVEHQLAVKDPSLATTIAGSAAGDSRRPQPGLFRSLFDLPRGDIRVSAMGDEVVCATDGVRLLTHSREGIREPAALQGLVQFMRYRYGGHPLLLEHLGALAFVPREVVVLALVPFGGFGAHVRLRIDGCQRTQLPARPDTSGLRKVTPFTDGPSDDIIQSCREASRLAAPEPAAARLAASLDALRHGDALDGVLSFFELTLECDVTMPPAFAEALNATSDSGVRYLLAALGAARHPKTSEAVEFALRAYEELGGAAKSKAHVLWAFEANIRAGRGEVDKARDLLTRALEANPRLAAAYKDLGDVFLGGFDLRRAWACWETGIAISPTHPVLRSVIHFEASLRAQYPDYFSL